MQIALTGADITAAIAAAFLSSASVELVPGVANYGITTGVEIPANRRLLVDFGATLRGQATNTAPLVKFTGDDAMLCGDGTLDGGNAAEQNGILHEGQKRVTIRGITLQNVHYTGIQLINGSDVTVEKCKIRDTRVGGIIHYFDQTRHPNPENIRIIGNDIDRNSATHDVEGVWGAILVYGGTGARTMTNVDVSGNTIKGRSYGTGNGIELLSASTYYPNYQNVTVCNNRITGTGLGISCGNSPTLTITGNAITSAHLYAIEISAWGGSCTGNVINGGNVGAGILVDGGTPVFGTGITVTANSIINTVGAAIQTSGQISGYVISSNIVRVGGGRGFFPQGTSPSNAIIIGNEWDGATVGSVGFELGQNHPFFIAMNRITRWSVNIQGQNGQDTITGNITT